MGDTDIWNVKLINVPYHFTVRGEDIQKQNCLLFTVWAEGIQKQKQNIFYFLIKSVSLVLFLLFRIFTCLDIETGWCHGGIFGQFEIRGFKMNPLVIMRSKWKCLNIASKYVKSFTFLLIFLKMTANCNCLSTSNIPSVTSSTSHV